MKLIRLLFYEYISLCIINVVLSCNELEYMRKSENKITFRSTGNSINQIIFIEHDCTVRHAEKSETRSFSYCNISQQI